MSRRLTTNRSMGGLYPVTRPRAALFERPLEGVPGHAGCAVEHDVPDVVLVRDQLRELEQRQRAHVLPEMLVRQVHGIEPLLLVELAANYLEGGVHSRIVQALRVLS